MTAMVVLSGLLGMAFYYQGLKRIPSRLSALTEMFFPVAAAGVNWIVLGMGLEMLQILGGIILVTASVQVQRLKTVQMA